VTTPPTDLVVVLPGILGSTLRQHGELVWAPSAGAALRAIATFGRSIRRLQLPDGIGDEPPGDGVEPGGPMPDLHILPGIWTPIKGYDRLVARLRALGYLDANTDPDGPPGNLLAVGYDWRLSNRYNAQRLTTLVEPALQRWRAQGGQYADAQVTFVCHSMGGLVARWHIEHCGGAEYTRKLITLGTPYRGAVKALEQLVNGVHPGLGPFAINLTRFVRSLPSMHQLLPEYACIEHDNDLAKTTEISIPKLDGAMVADGMLFHTELARAETQRPDSLATTHAIVGIHQPTATTARITGGHVTLQDTYRADNLYGDSTVPIVGACRHDVAMDSNTLRRIPDKHGNLQANKAALDELEGILTARPIVVRAPDTIELRVTAPELVLAGQTLPILVTTVDHVRHATRLTITDETGHLVHAQVLNRTTGTSATVIEDLAPGAYAITIAGVRAGSPIAPVSADVLVWDHTQMA
jgi:hypothetical protein